MARISRRHWLEGQTGSLFAYEGTFIAELRGALCLAGWPWIVADEVARELVAEALYRARAVRPTWAEGQRGFARPDVIAEAECRECGIPLHGRQVQFCSVKCRSAWWRGFNAEESEAA